MLHPVLFKYEIFKYLNMKYLNMKSKPQDNQNDKGLDSLQNNWSQFDTIRETAWNTQNLIGQLALTSQSPMSRCKKHIGGRPLAVALVFDVMLGPWELAIVWIIGVTTICNREIIRTKEKLAGTLLFGDIKGSGCCSGVAISRRTVVI